MRDRIEVELAMSAWIVARSNDMAPRFVIESPHGRLTVLCQWPQVEDVQRVAFGLLADLFRWRQVTGYLMSSELIEPPAIVVLSVSRSESEAALQTIKPGVGAIGPVQWHGRDAVDDMILALLPRGAATVSADRAADLARIFDVIERSDVDAAVVRFNVKGDPVATAAECRSSQSASRPPPRAPMSWRTVRAKRRT